MVAESQKQEPGQRSDDITHFTHQREDCRLLSEAAPTLNTAPLFDQVMS